MGEISFNEEPSGFTTRAGSVSGRNTNTALTRFVISTGFAKNPQGAQVVLLFIAMICFLVTLFLLVLSLSPAQFYVDHSAADATTARLERDGVR